MGLTMGAGIGAGTVAFLVTLTGTLLAGQGTSQETATKNIISPLTRIEIGKQL